MIGRVVCRVIDRGSVFGMIAPTVRFAFCQNNNNRPIKGFDKYRRDRKKVATNQEQQDKLKTDNVADSKPTGSEQPQPQTNFEQKPSQDKPSNQQEQKQEQTSEEPEVASKHHRDIIFLVNGLNQMELDVAQLKSRYDKIKASNIQQIVLLVNTQAVKQAGNNLSVLSNEVQNIRTILKEVQHKIKTKVDLDSQEIRSVPLALQNLRVMVIKLQSEIRQRSEVIDPIYDGMMRNNNGAYRLRWKNEKQERKTRPQPEVKKENKKEEDEQQKEHTESESYGKKISDGWQSFKQMVGDAFANVKFKFRPYYVLALALAVALFPTKRQYSEQELFTLLEHDKVRKARLVTVEDEETSYKVLEFQVDGNVGTLYTLNMDQLLQKAKEKYPHFEIDPDRKETIGLILRPITENMKVAWTFGLLVMYGVILFKISKGGAGKNPLGEKAARQRFDMTKQTGVKFANVAGLKESKFEIEEFVDFLKNPDRYQQLGARIPKGALLTGPPGTGKTMLAKATAGEAGVPFYFVSGSDFVEIYVGVGASRVRDLFKQAKANSPSIVFIDEIDAIGKKRQNSINSNSQKDGTLNQLLVQMDGFGTDNKVIVMAATNQKDLLDNALTRPGRFDRIIEVNLPDIEGRKEIFMVHLKPLKLSPVQSAEQYANRMATLTPGFSGAEIANLCNEAAITAARANKQFVEPFDFEMATQRVIGGVNRRCIMSKEQREVVAVHESGHAVVSWFLEGAYPLLKLTIIPRSKGALGFAQYLPSETRLETKEELLDRICFILGGRVAEQHFFKRVTTGAADDLQKAYRIAHDLVTKYGMSEKVGYIGYRDAQYLKQYSKKMAGLIDQQIRTIINRCADITRGMVLKHEQQIRQLSDRLLEKETLDGKQIRQILGQRPFAPHSSYKAYLQMQKAQKAQKAQKLDPPTPAPATN